MQSSHHVRVPNNYHQAWRRILSIPGSNNSANASNFRSMMLKDSAKRCANASFPTRNSFFMIIPADTGDPHRGIQRSARAMPSDGMWGHSWSICECPILSWNALPTASTHRVPGNTSMIFQNYSGLVVIRQIPTTSSWATM